MEECLAVASLSLGRVDVLCWVGAVLKVGLGMVLVLLQAVLLGVMTMFLVVMLGLSVGLLVVTGCHAPGRSWGPVS